MKKQVAVINLSVECYPIINEKVSPELAREYSKQILLGKIEDEDLDGLKSRINQLITKIFSSTKELRS